MKAFQLQQNNIEFIVQWSVTVRAILEESRAWQCAMCPHLSAMQEFANSFFHLGQFDTMANFIKILSLVLQAGEQYDQLTPSASLVLDSREICIALGEHIPEELLELVHFALKIVANSWSADEFSGVFDEAFCNAIKRCIKNVFGQCSKQLIACTCLAIIEHRSRLPGIKSTVMVMVIPCLLSIIEGDKSYGEIQPAHRAKASITLAFVLARGEDYQKIAEENRAIPKIQQMLVEIQNDASPVAALCIENALVALATLSSSREDVRASIFAYPKLVKLIVEFLRSHSDAIKGAACMLCNPNDTLRVAATATICNLVLEYSPLKKDAIYGETLEKLVFLCNHANEPNSQVRTNAIWAIKNITYQSSFEIKKQILEKFGSKIIFQLIRESEPSIQVQALNFLRNAICGSPQEINFVLDLLDAHEFFSTLMQIIEGKLDSLVEQCIFILVNVLTGDEKCRSFFIQPENHALLILIGDLLSHSHIEIKRGTLWAIYNMACGDEILAEKRILKMKELGFDQKITNLMLHESEPTVMDIAKKAISKFQNK